MAKREKAIKDKVLEKKDRVGFILDLFYAGIVILSIAIIVKLIHIQLTYSVDPSVENIFRPTGTKRPETPTRGAILSEDGRILAISTPMYQVYMDCAVRKDDFKSEGEEGAKKEKEWKQLAKELSSGLSAIYGDKSADDYYKFIISKRAEDRHYVKIGGPIDHKTLKKVQELPLFSKGSNYGGLLYETMDTREYPYGSLARRTIGYVKNNSRTEGKSHIGIEGKFDYELHGKDGFEWLRTADGKKKVRNTDSTAVKAVDGNDVRSTLNIDIQDIADRALRNQITEDLRVSGACAIVMDVKTGAIRAMVNLQRDTTLAGQPLQERFNLAISQVGEPGSVFKTVTLTSLLEDGYVKSLDETIPTNHGYVPGGYPHDDHISQYERNTGRNDITVKHGFEISSNYVFAYLATKYYGKKPQEFFNKLYSYRLGEKFDFDIDGLGTPVLTPPSNKEMWSETTLGTTAYGYSAAVTPLHLLTFYNGIANKGIMMKPYLVEDIENDGKVIKKRGPSVLNNICSRATADTLTRALMAVVEEGTATRLKGAKLTVAGKTGTARVALQASEKPKPHDGYHDIYGRKKNQGTFVGFFPADNPQYSVLVSVYSKLSLGNFYGGTMPAMAVREIIDNIYALTERWSDEIGRKGSVPSMGKKESVVADGITPDVRGFGLIDAIYAIENNGYKCSYEGTGHVASQSPAAGTTIKKGETVTLKLK